MSDIFIAVNPNRSKSAKLRLQRDLKRNYGTKEEITAKHREHLDREVMSWDCEECKRPKLENRNSKIVTSL